MADYMPTTNEDAQRQQVVSRAFYLLADVLAGTDSQPRVDSQTVRADGLLGTPTNSTDVAVGANGELFIRGRSGQLYSTGTTATPKAAAATVAGVPPWLLLVGLFFLLRR